MAYTTRVGVSEQQESASQQKAAAQIADNRTSTATQLKQQTLMATSPQVAAQRQLADSMATSSVQQLKTIQRAAPEEELQMKSKTTAQLAEDEELLQGKFATAQLAADEELLQGKFATAQLAEDEELLQGKFTTAQLAEDEELLQGKFATAQLAQDEELLQGKFATAQFAEDEELLQGKFTTAQLAEDEELLQGKFSTADSLQRKEQSPANKTGLPDNLKSGIENLSGHSLDDVKVHYNSSQPASLQAHAYAQGSDIHVAPGQEKHLPHEAWHVVQQKQGRVQPTMQTKGVAVNNDTGLESEADVMGAKALQMAEKTEL